MEQNTTLPSPAGEPQKTTEDIQHEKSVRFKIGILGFVLFIIFVVGLFWLATTPEQTVGLTLSFVAGLSMIFLPCTLPLAFVIVPLTLGKDPKKGLFMALSFALGLTITLSFYGVFIAALGKAFGLKSDAEVYAVLLGGIAAFLFGLSEIGLLNFKLPSYSGKFPDFIQRQKDYLKTFLLGLLLGNAGVGCPNPAFYVLLGYIASTGDLFNGWFLGFVHGLGRSVPLIFLAILGTLGVNALSGLARHKDVVQRAMGWTLLLIGGYLLTFGIFGHDWFIASGVHGTWEQFVNSIGGQRFGEVILKHEHKLIDVPNFIQYGNMFFLGLVAFTFLIAFIVKRPSRRTMVTLSAVYIALVLIIGFSTDWTFKIGSNVHIQFQGATEGAPHKAPPDEASPHEEAHGPALYHEETDVREGLVVNLNATPVPVLAGTTTRLDFFVNKKPGNFPVPAFDLEIEHEKLMHVIGVRDDMNNFFHIHPQPVPMLEYDPVIASTLSAPYNFAQPGRYKIWSEVKRDGTIHTFGHPEIDVRGEGQKSNKQISFGRNVIVGNYQVALDDGGPIGKGHEAHLSFDIHTLTGQEVGVEPYIGAAMHLTLIKDDWKQFIHAHPEGDGEDTDNNHGARLIHEAQAHGAEEVPGAVSQETGEDEEINFHVVFPEAGLYKAFAQFRPRGINLPPDEALRAEFWIEVKESVGFSSSAQWWFLLIVSAVLTILLSLGVRKFLRVNAEKIKNSTV